MAITDYIDFVNNYLTKNGMIGNAANINKAPDQLKKEIDELNQSIGTLNGDSVKLTGNQTIAGVKTFSSNIVGSISGNSATATKLATARTINGVSFDGTANITVSDSTAVKLTGDQTIAGIKTFTASQRGTITTDNDGNLNLNATNNFSVTPTGTFALTFTNISEGQSGQILLDNSGGHIITADTNTKVDANFLSTVSNAGVYVLGYFSDGTNVYVYNTGAMG